MTAVRLCVLIVLLVAGGPTAVGTPRREVVCPRPAASAETSQPRAAPASWTAPEYTSTTAVDAVPVDAIAPPPPSGNGPPTRGATRAAAYTSPSVSLPAGRGPPAMA